MSQLIQGHANKTTMDKFIPTGGLSALGKVQLSPAKRQMLDSARRSCAGPVVWRNRKVAEAHDLLALA